MLFVLVLVLVSFSLVYLLTLLTLFMSELIPLSREESSTYECGFEHHSLSRLPFSIRYFMLTLVFLIFDMEVMLLLFIPGSTVVLSTSGVLQVSVVLLFIVVLFAGLIYEWVDGSLEWVM